MKKMMVGAMMAGLLGLASAGATTAQVVAQDGWWSSDYQSERGADRARGERGPGNRDDYYDDYYDDGRRDDRGRIDVRADGRVGVRLPGRVVVTARRVPRIDGRGVRPLYWDEVRWNVRFQERYIGHGYRASLRDIVGKRTFKQLQRHRDRLHVRGALTYRWVDLGRRGTMLQVRAGRIPIAELIDFGSDLYVDVVRLNQAVW